MHYVYIIQSKLDGSFYKGYSADPALRLHFHNEGRSPYTSHKKPWELVAVLYFAFKTEALQKEKKIKKYNTRSLQALIDSDQNKIVSYLKGLENC
ncbi:MAG: GIY-YIG nuclease family protein [Chitinophagaceae bacterium]|nr:MAG: GIY-YIG nuclease family protein [Chitinophagaceae bacterium]